MDDKIELVGYHGTKKESVDSICRDNFFINEDKKNKLFLGAGIYFFYLCDDAVDWNIKEFKKEFLYFPTWDLLLNKRAVIESKIMVNENEMLDLDDKEKLYKLEIALEKYKGKLITKPEYLNASNKTAAIINMLYKRKMMQKKIISKTFMQRINAKMFDRLTDYPRKMFCVKDKSIILENREKLDINEELFNSIIYFYK